MARIFALAEGAYQRGTDYDIVMLYQVLLGRNPESSQVIMEHRSNTLDRAFHTFVNSDEFRDSVLGPIGRSEPVRRHDIVPRPSTEHLNWLFNRTVLDEADRAALRAADSWNAFFASLLGMEGFMNPLPMRPAPQGASQGAPPAEAGAPMPRRAAVVPPAEAAPMPSAEALTARLDRIEALLTQIAARLDAPHAAAPAAVPDVAPAAKSRPSSKRQAR